MITTLLFLALLLLFAVVCAMLLWCRVCQHREDAAARQEADASASRHRHVAARLWATPPTSIAMGRSARLLLPHRCHCPVPPVIIANLPTLVYTPLGKQSAEDAVKPGLEAPCKTPRCEQQQQQQQQPDAADTGVVCAICLAAYEPGCQIKLLPCLHRFHARCIDAWLARDRTCPICQGDVVLAAGLSAKADDWSRHTLESVYRLSGTAGSPRGAAAACSVHWADEAQGDASQSGQQEQQEQQQAAGAGPQMRVQRQAGGDEAGQLQQPQQEPDLELGLPAAAAGVGSSSLAAAPQQALQPADAWASVTLRIMRPRSRRDQQQQPQPAPQLASPPPPPPQQQQQQQQAQPQAASGGS